MARRLPSRPSPMRCPPGGVGRHECRSPMPQRHQPLALAFRRPPTGVPAAHTRSGNGAPVSLSLHFSWRVWLAERLTTVVRQATEVPNRASLTGPEPAGHGTASRTGATPSTARSVTHLLPFRSLEPPPDDGTRPTAGRSPLVPGRSPAGPSTPAGRPGPRLPVRRPNDDRPAPPRLARARDDDRPVSRPADSSPPAAPMSWASWSVAQRHPTAGPIARGAAARPGGRLTDWSLRRRIPGTARHPDGGALSRPSRRRALVLDGAPQNPRARATPVYRTPVSAGGHRTPGPALVAGPGPRTGPGAELVHREEARHAVVTAPPPNDVAVTPVRPVPPPMDLDRLGEELWKRFEKRVRVENERRGKW